MSDGLLYTLSPDASGRACRLGIYGALSTALGIVLSGPLAVMLVNAIHPQPPWQGPELFVRSYHAIQLLPYLGGIILVGGIVVLVTSTHAIAPAEQKPLATVALVFVSGFATLIFLNYIVQTTFVPVLVQGHVEANGPLVAALSMANPKSLAWAIEMWGWGLLGVATWLVAPVFRYGGIERATSWAFIANGPISIAGIVWTVIEPGWAMSTVGLVAFALWNALLFAMAVLATIALRGRLRGRQWTRHDPGSGSPS